jgi:hypothetical protein
MLKEGQWEKNERLKKKIVKLFLVPKEVWQVFFCKVELTWKRTKAIRKDEK